MDGVTPHCSHVGVVVIGRNEGERLRRCLESIPPGYRTVYVDSGSVDGSAELATSLGVEVIPLDPGNGFTAARARNAGWRLLLSAPNPPAFIQFVDGDCELNPAWLAVAESSLHREPKLAVSFGRLRERNPFKSIYNQLCDDEWNVPVGLTSSCGGIAMFRSAPLQASGGFSSDLIAGEEPDLCLRLAMCGWQIRRIDQEMGTHDAAINSFRQWWRRSRRSGFAYAEHVSIHRFRSIPGWPRQVASILTWGGLIPLLIIICFLASIKQHQLPMSICLGLILLYLIQWVRLTIYGSKRLHQFRKGLWFSSITLISKSAQLIGMIQYIWHRLTSKYVPIIEYKTSHG